MAAQPETCYRHPDEETGVHCTRCGRPICPECMTPAPVGHHCPTCVAEGQKGMRRRLRIPRPRGVTQTLIAANVVVFALELALGGATNIGVLVRLGAMVPELVAAGQYWRLLAATFIHVGVLHLVLNGFGLYLFGSLLESVLGSARMLGLYLATGLFASAVSFAFGDPGRVAAGASGAIFGLLGAWLAYNWRRRNLSIAQANLRGALILIAVNVTLGLSVPGIDNLAHLGGLAAGIVAGLVVEGWGTRKARVLTGALGLVAIVVAGALLVTWRVTTLT